MPSPFFVADATKAVPLSEVPPEQWATWVGAGSKEVISATEAWRCLGVFYRAVDLRAKAVSRAPLLLFAKNGRVDISQQPQHQAFMQRLRSLLYLNEAAICTTGASYWIIETNAAGRNPTPRWLLPSSMAVKRYENGEPAAWSRTVNGQSKEIDTKQIVYWWEPNLMAESGPGVPVAARALASAGVLHHLNLYVGSFFERGAIKAYVIQAEGNPSAADRERVKSAWRRLLSGVRAAFSVEVFNKSITFQALGDSLKETVNPMLTSQAREDVLQTFGVPLSLVMSNAANYATAQQDQLGFYSNTIAPQVEALHLPPLNAWLNTQGLRVDVDWNQLEVFQAQQLAQAQAVNQLVGGPILTVDEGRALIGYEPMPNDKAPDPALPPPAAVPEKPVPPDENAAKATDLERWQRKALKRLKESGSAVCDFESAAIPARERQRITTALTHATTPEAVKAAFKAKARRVRADDVDSLTGDLLARAAKLAAEVQAS